MAFDTSIDKLSAGTKQGAPPPQGPPPQPDLPPGAPPPVRPKETLWHDLMEAFLPNRAVNASTMRLIVIVQVAIAGLIWLNSPFKVLPRPDEVFAALRDLWMHEGLGPELGTSFTVNLKAVGL